MGGHHALGVFFIDPIMGGYHALGVFFIDPHQFVQCTHSYIAVNSKVERRKFADAIERHVKEQLPELSAEMCKNEVDRHFWPGAVTRLTVGMGEEAHDI